MIRIVPSDQVPWADVEAIFDGSEPGKCHCQRYKVKGWIWRDSTLDERVAAHEEQSARGSGLVAYVDDQPAGWVAVEPRCDYAKLPMLLLGGAEDGCITPDNYAGAATGLAPGSRVEIVAGAGHFLRLDHPDEVAALALDWLS